MGSDAWQHVEHFMNSKASTNRWQDEATTSPLRRNLFKVSLINHLIIQKGNENLFKVMQLSGKEGTTSRSVYLGKPGLRSLYRL